MNTTVTSLLKNVDARYGRVLAQGEELGGSIQSWVANNGIVGRAEIADDRLSWSLFVEATGSPPLEDWGHLYGEAVHNLRACLDNLAWALANINGPPQKPTAVQFPIVDDRTNWRSEKSRVVELPPAAQDAIELIQPFQRDVESSDAPRKDALVLLRDMSNMEKHRVALQPSVTLESLAHSFAVKFMSVDDAAAETPPDVEVSVRPITESGTWLRQKTKHPIDRVIGEFNFGAKVVVTHPDHSPVGITQSLALMAQYVKTVIDYVLSHVPEGQR